MRTEYLKLVRDNIPEIIESQGEKPFIRILDDAEFLRCLDEKLNEEIAEYRMKRETEELADILEVIFALAKINECSKEELLTLCERKRTERGGFDKRIFLIEKEHK